MTRQRLIIGAGVSTFTGALLGVIMLIVLNAWLLSIPLPLEGKSRSGSGARADGGMIAEGTRDFKAVLERNLFRAKLQAEIPKPRSEKEIEEEALVAILTPMILKGVMTGHQTRDSFAVIDRGGQKGVWTYEAGETIERGLTITEIRKDAVVIQKGDFAAILRLFARSFERIPGTGPTSATRETMKRGDRPL